VNLNLTLIGQMITFIIFVAFTMKFVWPPVTAAMQARQKRIAEGLAAADQGKESLEMARLAASEILREAKAQAAKYIEEANQRALHIIEESKHQARQESARIINHANDMISIEKNNAREALRQEIGHLALLGANKILNQEIDVSMNDSMIEQLIAEVASE
jgi:F-type H+-transporting ATPase subunit b